MCLLIASIATMLSVLSLHKPFLCLTARYEHLLVNPCGSWLGVHICPCHMLVTVRLQLDTQSTTITTISGISSGQGLCLDSTCRQGVPAGSFLC